MTSAGEHSLHVLDVVNVWNVPHYHVTVGRVAERVALQRLQPPQHNSS
jgi:hypothetical protein